MRLILAGTEDPIDFLRRRIVAADNLVSLGGEPDLASGESQAMRSTQRAEVDRGQSLLLQQINYCQGVVGPAAVVGDVGESSISGGDHFVRVRTGWHTRDDFTAHRIHDGESVVGLSQHQE